MSPGRTKGSPWMSIFTIGFDKHPFDQAKLGRYKHLCSHCFNNLKTVESMEIC